MHNPIAYPWQFSLHSVKWHRSEKWVTNNGREQLAIKCGKQQMIRTTSQVQGQTWHVPYSDLIWQHGTGYRYKGTLKAFKTAIVATLKAKGSSGLLCNTWTCYLYIGIHKHILYILNVCLYLSCLHTTNRYR